MGAGAVIAAEAAVRERVDLIVEAVDLNDPVPLVVRAITPDHRVGQVLPETLRRSVSYRPALLRMELICLRGDLYTTDE
jgi:hypothetical protein